MLSANVPTTATSRVKQQPYATVLASTVTWGDNGGMQIRVFRSERDPLAIGFTSDRSGLNLPADLAPWRPLWGAILPTGPEFAAFAETRAMVEAHGFCVRRTEHVA
jgi:hypothetical protein